MVRSALNYLKIQPQEMAQGCHRLCNPEFLLLISISHFKFSFLKVLVKLPTGNNKMAITYDKGIEQKRLVITIVKRKRMKP